MPLFVRVLFHAARLAQPSVRCGAPIGFLQAYLARNEGRKFLALIGNDEAGRVTLPLLFEAGYDAFTAHFPEESSSASPMTSIVTAFSESAEDSSTTLPASMR